MASITVLGQVGSAKQAAAESPFSDRRNLTAIVRTLDHALWIKELEQSLLGIESKVIP